MFNPTKLAKNRQNPVNDDRDIASNLALEEETKVAESSDDQLSAPDSNLERDEPVLFQDKPEDFESSDEFFGGEKNEKVVPDSERSEITEVAQDDSANDEVDFEALSITPQSENMENESVDYDPINEISTVDEAQDKEYSEIDSSSTIAGVYGNNNHNSSSATDDSVTSSMPSMSSEIDRLENEINSVPNLPADLKSKSMAMIYRLKNVAMDGGYSKEYEPVAEYIHWITQIPWGTVTQDILEMTQVKEELVKHHYGLDPVKQRLMEYLAIIKLKEMGLTKVQEEETNGISQSMSKLKGSSSNAPVLCFVGIQGVGKTSMAKSIANALGREFVRIPLGAVGSVSEIRGRSRGELDAEPGQVIKALIRSKSMNPVILLDEIDKTSSATGLRADIMAALLEILDPEQNSTFMDKYVDYPVDLSKVFFITTANNLGGISAALLDRLEIIRFGSYTDNDKIQIAKNYLLPKVRKSTGLTQEQFDFDDDVWPMVVRPLGFDAGVRQLERTLSDLARKVALQIVQGVRSGVKITKANFREFIPEDIGVYS